MVTRSQSTPEQPSNTGIVVSPLGRRTVVGTVGRLCWSRPDAGIGSLLEDTTDIFKILPTEVRWDPYQYSRYETIFVAMECGQWAEHNPLGGPEYAISVGVQRLTGD